VLGKFQWNFTRPTPMLNSARHISTPLTIPSVNKNQLRAQIFFCRPTPMTVRLCSREALRTQVRPLARGPTHTTRSVSQSPNNPQKTTPSALAPLPHTLVATGPLRLACPKASQRQGQQTSRQTRARDLWHPLTNQQQIPPGPRRLVPGPGLVDSPGHTHKNVCSRHFVRG